MPGVKYLLPDRGELGRIAEKNESIEGKQVLPMNNLRITIPEILFQPTDAGLQDGGIQQAIEEALACVDPEMKSELISNFEIVGGSSQFGNLGNRL